MSASQPEVTASRPTVIGHRGASGYVPEHTLTSYFIAVQQGADYIEPDLVSTRDGMLIARHENEIGATTDVAEHPRFASRRTRKVVDGLAIEGWFAEDFTLAEIKQLKARERIAQIRPANARFDAQFEVPTFDEILALVQALESERARTAGELGLPPPARIGVYPETKHPSYFAQQGLALEPPLLAALARYGYAGRRAPIYIQSFEVANLQALRASTHLPLVQLAQESGAPFDFTLRGDARTYRDLLTPAGLADIARYADAIGVEKVLIIPRTTDGALGVPTELVPAAHAAGLAVHAWTFRAENFFLPPALRSSDEPSALGDLGAELAAYFATGLDGFFIDQPVLGVRARAAWRTRRSAAAAL
jgi:glycerophosphoryl diester phosphodiesterase